MNKDITLIVSGSSSETGQKLIPILQVRGYRDILGIYNSHPSPSGVMPEVSLDHVLKDEFVLRGRPRICLINLFGITVNKSIGKLTKEDWYKTFEVNVHTNFNLIQKFWPLMKSNKYGRIILIGSVVPHMSIFGTSAYSTTKAALEGLRHELVVEGVKDNILTFGLDLGYVDAGMTHRIPKDLLTNIKETIPLKRFATIEEIANSIEFLINTPYMVGQTLHLNGGLYLG